MAEVREWGRVRAPNHYCLNSNGMDNTHTHNLGGRERAELMAKIQRLEWLLSECIGLEEYELCSQIKRIIQQKYELLATNENENIIE
jgi:hypothetical protein